MKGKLYLVPNTLDSGASVASAPDLQEVLPLGVIRIAARLSHWVAENAKTTRAFLKRVDEVVPLVLPLQSLAVVELVRATTLQGRDASMAAMHGLLLPARQGHDIGLISEAGLPAIADPGAALVAAAHAEGIVVVPLCGPSSLLLGLAASGLNGQSFAFVGYLPVQAAARSARIRELEMVSRQTGQSQLIIETPYRNAALFATLLATLAAPTRLAVSCGLTLALGWSYSATVAQWKSMRRTMPADVPAIFALSASHQN